MARKAQAVSIYRIAEEAGVSVPTVSRVINRKSGIAEKTRNKVNAILQQYNFRPEYPAMRTLKIAVIYPWAELSDYFRKAMKGIYAYAGENKLMVNIIVANSYTKESLRETIRDQQCSGVVALIGEHYREEIDTLRGTDLPVVVIDSVIEGENIGFIDNDSYYGSAQGARLLAELGHTKIGYITHGHESLNQLQRFKGAENTFKACGIELPEERIVRLTSDLASLSRGESGYNAMKQLLKQAPDITAVMAVDDSMALGALAAINEAGLKVPEDISVIGFDNYPETKFWSPGLTTIDHPVEKAGEMAIKAVHEALGKNGDWVPPREILSTELVVRKSTGPAKKQVD